MGKSLGAAESIFVEPRDYNKNIELRGFPRHSIYYQIRLWKLLPDHSEAFVSWDVTNDLTQRKWIQLTRLISNMLIERKYPSGIYLFKVNNRNIRTTWKICSRLIKTSLCSDVEKIANFCPGALNADLQFNLLTCCLVCWPVVW